MLPNGTLIPLSSTTDRSVLEVDMYSELMSNDNTKGDYDKCQEMVYRLFRKEANAWCDFAHDRDCSFAGIYQPPLPLSNHDFEEFIVSSNFVDVFAFLQLGDTSDLASVREGARKICTMSLFELEVYNSKLSKSISDLDELVQYCFRATFVASFLIDGIGFPSSANVTAIDVIDGQKLGVSSAYEGYAMYPVPDVCVLTLLFHTFKKWALGSTLYEINTLPWEFEGALLTKIEHEKKRENGTAVLMDIVGKLDGVDGVDGNTVFEFVRRYRGVSAIVTVLVVAIAALVRWTRKRPIRSQLHQEAIVLLEADRSRNSNGERNIRFYGTNHC